MFKCKVICKTQLSKSVILLDWSGVDLTPKSTLYAKKLVELQDSNTAPNQIYTINSKSWQRVVFR